MTVTVKTPSKPEHEFSGRLKAYKASGGGVVIEGFANAATVDRAKELIDPDAFTKNKGLDNFMKNPVMLFDHGMDPNVGSIPIGKFTEVSATENGLFVKGKLSQAKDPPISTIRTLVSEGILRSFSVGFNPEEVDQPDEKGVSVIKSAELFEVSVVGIPMNQDSLFSVSQKSGKKLLTKSYNQIVAAICKQKGAGYAEAANLQIDEIVKGGTDRGAIVSEIAEKAGVSEAVILDVLSGALQEVTEQLRDAFKSVLGDIDVKTTDDKEEENDENKPGEGEEEEDKKTFGDEDDDSEEGDESDEDKGQKDFQDCVNEKIPKLINEGKDNDEAVATAISMCRDSQKCAINPTKDMYESFLKTIEETRKQADQSEAGVDETTEPIRTTTPESELGASPMLDQTKQTNVLLGTIANEFKLFQEGFRGMTDEIVNAINQLGGKSNVDEAGKNSSDQVTMESSDTDETKRRVDRAKKHLENLASRLEKMGVSLNDKEL